MALRRVVLFVAAAAAFYFAMPVPLASATLADAGSEHRRFEDEQLYRKMQEHLEKESEPEDDLIRFADPAENPAESQPQKKNKFYS